MAAICQAESGGNASAVNPSGCGVGLGQVNVFAHTQYSAADMMDPSANADASYAIYQSQGLTAWEAYTNGAYRQYLGSCGGSASPGGSALSLPGGNTLLVGAGLLIGAVLLWDVA